jgi:hypothetical protein
MLAPLLPTARTASPQIRLSRPVKSLLTMHNWARVVGWMPSSARDPCRALMLSWHPDDQYPLLRWLVAISFRSQRVASICTRRAPHQLDKPSVPWKRLRFAPSNLVVLRVCRIEQHVIFDRNDDGRNQRCEFVPIINPVMSRLPRQRLIPYISRELKQSDALEVGIRPHEAWWNNSDVNSMNQSLEAAQRQSRRCVQHRRAFGVPAVVVLKRSLVVISCTGPPVNTDDPNALIGWHSEFVLLAEHPVVDTGENSQHLTLFIGIAGISILLRSVVIENW